MSAKTDFENYVFTSLNNRIQLISELEAKTMCALSLQIDDQTDTDYAAIDLSANTFENLKEQTSNASDHMEAKWNFAFWTQESLLIIANSDDPEGLGLLENWIDEEGIDYENLYEDWLPQLWPLVARAAARLHTQGVIKAKFGQSIPIVIHNLEYGDLSIEATESANPGIPLDGFKQWAIGE